MNSLPLNPEKSRTIKKRFVLIVTLVLASLTLSTTVLAGDVFHFRGQGAQAFFSSSDGCIVTDVSVFASDGRAQNPPGPADQSSEGFVFISKYDICTGTQLISAFGSTLLADQDLQIDRKLNSATLNTTIEVFDFVSQSSFNVDIALTWTGAGDLTHRNSHFHFRSPGFTINQHFSGILRPAQASGSISDGTTNFTPQPLVFADIQSLKSGTVSINKQ